MIDKVQKIKEQANIDIFNLRTAQEEGIITEFGRGKLEALEGIVDFIDSLQEEPVSKVWHDSNKEQPEYGSDVVVLQGYEGEVLHRVVKVNPDRIWAYIEDLLNLSNVERTVKNWKEPVSEDLEEAYKTFSKETAYLGLTYRDTFKAGAHWQKEQLIAKAIDAHCFGFQGAALFSFRLPASKYLVGSKVKVTVIKED